jgi:hypothetical protein
MGEQAPYNDSSEVKAKCTDCLEKEKEAASRFKPSPEMKDGQEVTLDCGAKGRLWAVKGEAEKLSLWDLAVSGKKFYCSDKTREQFQKYLDGVKNDEVDVTFLHSVTCTIDLPARGRKKKEEAPKAEEKKTESVQYNCTVKVNKKFALSMFEGMVDRLNSVLDILLRADLRRLEELSQKKHDAVKGAV